MVSILMDLNKTVQYKMTLIEVPAGKFNELTWLTLRRFTLSAILVLSFLEHWTNFWQSDVLKN